MSFPKYPKYKDSGVEWLGEVPEHWEVWKLSHAFSVIGSGTTPKSDDPQFYEDGTIPWVNTGDLNDGALTTCSKQISGIALAQHSSLKIYPAGSILIAMYGATIGKLGLLQFPATVNQACCVFAGESSIVPVFMFYWFFGLRQQILSLATGGGQPNVSQDILRTIRVACPEKSEQTAIAAFLDCETAKIDELVAEQRRLIELLKEKRQAVISHAVTKGLNPNVPMKPSGIEWLGDVPEHWVVKPLRSIATVVRGASPRPAGDPRYFGGSVMPWVTVAEITKDDRVDLTETEFFLTEEGAEHSNLFPSGTVIYSNSGATLGVPKILRIDACANDGVVAFKRLNDHVHPQFLYHYLASITEAIREKVKQGSGQPNLNTDIVKAL
jgi:type I restriction enzyme S subunit